jgi:hypothetical protein
MVQATADAGISLSGSAQNNACNRIIGRLLTKKDVLNITSNGIP